MEKDWVRIHSTNMKYLVEIWRGLLQEHDIDCVVLSQRDSPYGTFGEHELYVHRDNAIRAKHLILNEEEL